MNKLIFIIFIFLTTHSFCQVQKYYDRGDEWGYHDNSYKYKLLHSDTITGCSCEALFNYLESSSYSKLYDCMEKGADMNCTIVLFEDIWSRHGFFGKWSTITWRISPYHYSVLKNQFQIVKKYNEYSTNLDIPMYRTRDSLYPKSILDIAAEITDNSKVYNYLIKKGVWSTNKKSKVLFKLMNSIEKVREDFNYLDTISDIITKVNDRKLFYSIDQKIEIKDEFGFDKKLTPRDIIIRSIKYNIPEIYMYLMSNYQFLNERTSQNYYAYSLRSVVYYPTIEEYDYFIDNKILLENDMSILGEKKYLIPNSNMKLIHNYFYLYLQEKDNQKKTNRKKMDKIRKKLAAKNGY